MNRRNFIKNTGLTIGGLFFISGHSMASFLTETNGKIVLLNKNTGIYIGKGGTILFKWHNDGVIVIDSQFPDYAENFLEQLKQYTSVQPSLLINTHHHADHTSGNIVFKNMVSKVVAHENALKFQQSVAQANNNVEKQLFPNQTFSTELQLKSGNETIELSYFGPAHTSGDIVVYLKKAGVAHLGDLVFNRRFPFIDKSSGASIKNWIHVLEQIRKKYPDNTTFVCGHCAESYDVIIQKKDILAFQQYLQNALNFVEKEIKDGKIKEEILAATSIPGSPEWKGAGIERTLDAAYKEITANYK